MNNEKISFKEQAAYSLGDVGCNFVWTTISSFLMLYYTDYAGIAAAAVGTMMLIVRLLDAGTDFVMGAIIDKSKLKMGKTRPWIAISAPFAFLAMVLLFNVPPSWAYNDKLIYSYLTYFFLSALVYTMANVSYNTLISLIARDPQNKAKLSAVRFIFTVPAMALIGIVTPILLERISFGKISIIYGALAMVLLLVCAFGTKERYQTDESQFKIPFKQSVKAVIKNRYFLPITIFYILFYSLNALFSGSGIYYMRDVMGDAGLFGLSQAMQLPGVLLTLLLFTRLVKRFGKWRIMMMSLALFALAIVPLAIFPTSVPIMLITSFFKGVAMGGALGDLFTVVADIVDYGEYKTGVRSDGLIFGATNFGIKVGTGLGAALMGWTLDWGGYQAGAAVTERVTVALKSIYLYQQLAVLCLLMLVFAFCNVDKIYSKVAEYFANKQPES